MSRLTRYAYSEVTLRIYRDEAAHDADAPPNVELTRNGETVDTGSATAIVGETGAYVYPVPSELTDALGPFEAVWTYTVDATSTTAHQAYEVVGGPVVTLAELRKLEPLDDQDRYPDELVLAARDAVIEALEDACNVSFTRRLHTEELNDAAVMGKVALARSRRPVISAASVNGVDLTDDDLAALRIGTGGLVSRPYGAFGNTTRLTYEQGYDTPPGRVVRAVKLLTRDWLVEELNDAIPSRATSWTAGENTYRLVTAGVAGALFDLPEANAVVKQYRE